ncbi:MAG: thioredoxin domain-containing protein [Alphaproteobacteria bacterium]
MNKILAMATGLTLCLAAGVAMADGPRNHLANASSPYLRLHSPDPVHWRVWSEATLAEAKKLGKPILLNIGYLSCHWCHVMQRESFSDPDTAKIINTDFFPILVDREEMPDLDASFQTAASLMRTGGGWPLNMFLTADAKPFWGGTYFPKQAIAGMAPFTQVLDTVSALYRDDPDAAVANAELLAGALDKMSASRPGTVTVKDIDAVARSFVAQVGPFRGGFGDAPLFPMTAAQAMLWRAYLRTGETQYRDAIVLTLSAMARGGIYDHVGGGFFRYAVDAEWNVPHFEKMLDINANILALMVEVWRETRNPLLARRIDETVTFLLREMRLGDGAFASALDADSISAVTGEEEEGAFYLWSETNLKERLGPDAEYFMGIYGLTQTEDGDDGPDDPQTLHVIDGLPADKHDRLRGALKKLFEARRLRPRPRRDDKVLADWNAMLIVALTEAGLAFEKPNWVAAAARAFATVDKNLTDANGRLHHSRYDGQLGEKANLDDLGSMAGAALTLFEATGDAAYVDTAEGFIDLAISHHLDAADGAFYATASDAGPQLQRAKPVYDNPDVSGNARIIETLSRLYYLGGDGRFLKLADDAIKAFGGEVKNASLGLAGYLNAVETQQRALQIVIIGGRGGSAEKKLLRQVTGASLPTRVLDVIAPGTVLPDTHPAQYKTQVDGLPTAYVCKGSFCSLPATTPEGFRDSLIMLRQGGS